MTDDVATAWEGRYLSVKARDRWEYAARKGDVHAAVILAIDAGEVLLVEQDRVPIGSRCIELPAGLVGDEAAGEETAAAAIRELEEETGYRAEAMEPVGEFIPSAGMTSERFTLLRARGLTKVGNGGGVPGENITVHRVALKELPTFLASRRAAGCAVDARILLLLGPSILADASSVAQ